MTNFLIGINVLLVFTCLAVYFVKVGLVIREHKIDPLSAMYAMAVLWAREVKRMLLP
jgi:hypothetical protein